MTPQRASSYPKQEKLVSDEAQPRLHHFHLNSRLPQRDLRSLMIDVMKRKKERKEIERGKQKTHDGQERNILSKSPLFVCDILILSFIGDSSFNQKRKPTDHPFSLQA